MSRLWNYVSNLTTYVIKPIFPTFLPFQSEYLKSAWVSHSQMVIIMLEIVVRLYTIYKLSTFLWINIFGQLYRYYFSSVLHGNVVIRFLVDIDFNSAYLLRRLDPRPSFSDAMARRKD